MDAESVKTVKKHCYSHHTSLCSENVIEINIRVAMPETGIFIKWHLLKRPGPLTQGKN